MTNALGPEKLVHTGRFINFLQQFCLILGGEKWGE